ncbi:MAG TPA: hypothetical protein VII06_12215 [Chloroflexota bacterium]|jgi:hypothetical protein
MSEGYETFVRDLADLRVGQETVLVLRDLSTGRRKYFARNVIGVVAADEASDMAADATGATAADSPDTAGDWHPLTVRSAVGHRFPGAWRVRIVKMLPPAVPGAPYTDAYAAMQAAWGATHT